MLVDLLARAEAIPCGHCTQLAAHDNKDVNPACSPPGAQQLDDLISRCSLLASCFVSTRRPPAGLLAPLLHAWLAFLLPPSLPPFFIHVLPLCLETMPEGSGGPGSACGGRGGGSDRAASVDHPLLCLSLLTTTTLPSSPSKRTPFHAHLTPPTRTHAHLHRPQRHRQLVK